MIPFDHEWSKHCFTCVYHDIIRYNYMWEVGRGQGEVWERAGGGGERAGGGGERAGGGGGEGRRRWGRGQGEVGERAGGGAVSPYLFYTLWWDATGATHPYCYEVVCSLSPKVICSHLFPSSVKGERRAVPLDCTSLHRRHHFVVISHWRDDFYCSLSACPIAL